MNHTLNVPGYLLTRIVQELSRCVSQDKLAPPPQQKDKARDKPSPKQNSPEVS